MLKLDTRELAEVVNSKLDHHKWIRGIGLKIKIKKDFPLKSCIHILD
jgi:hypothetical protein